MTHPYSSTDKGSEAQRDLFAQELRRNKLKSWDWTCDLKSVLLPHSLPKSCSYDLLFVPSPILLLFLFVFVIQSLSHVLIFETPWTVGILSFTDPLNWGLEEKKKNRNESIGDVIKCPSPLNLCFTIFTLE